MVGYVLRDPHLMNQMSLLAICEGMIRVRDNAAELLEDARLLRENGRVSRAYTLAYMACEEYGKLSILIGVAVKMVVGIPVAWKATRKRFNSHNSKASQFVALARTIPLILEAAASGSKTVNTEELMIKASVGVLFGPTMFSMRNASIYCDFVDNSFVGPSEQINESMADQIIGYAQTHLATASRLIVGTPEDLAQWLKSSYSRERYDKMMAFAAEASESLANAFQKST